MEKDELEKEAQKEEIRNIAAKVERFIDDEKLVCGRELKAVKLHLFKSIYTDKLSPDNEEQRKVLRERSEKIMRHEQESKKITDLPTIGIEIEVPAEVIPNDDFFDEVLKAFNIPHFGGMTETGFKYFEVNPEYTFSAYAQSRIVEDLAEMGMFGKVPEQGNKYSNDMLSLHINLGIPDTLSDLTVEQIQEGVLFHEIDILTNAIAYSYVSSERLRDRKSIESWDWTDDSVEDSSKGSKRRLELKIGEMVDYKNFREIEEIQRLGGSMFSFMAKELGKKFKEKLSDNWIKFREVLTETFRKYNLEMNIFELQGRRSEAAEMAKNEDLHGEIRTNITQHASLQMFS